MNKAMIKIISVFILLNLFASPTWAQEAPAATLSYSQQLLQVLMVLALIVAIIIGGGWLSKKMANNHFGASKKLSIKATLPLSNKERLHVIDVNGEQILIGVTAGGISHLKNLEKPLSEAEASTEPMANVALSFQKVLSQLQKS